MMLFANLLSVATDVDGCEWPIYATAVLEDIAFWKFSNNPPNSASMADAITFIIMMHYTRNGTFYWGIACIGVLDFAPMKKIHLLCFVPLVLRCRMHPNICGEPFRFLCILLQVVDVLRFSLKTE